MADNKQFYHNGTGLYLPNPNQPNQARRGSGTSKNHSTESPSENCRPSHQSNSTNNAIPGIYTINICMNYLFNFFFLRRPCQT